MKQESYRMNLKILFLGAPSNWKSENYLINWINAAIASLLLK